MIEEITKKIWTHHARETEDGWIVWEERDGRETASLATCDDRWYFRIDHIDIHTNTSDRAMALRLTLGVLDAMPEVDLVRRHLEDALVRRVSTVIYAETGRIVYGGCPSLAEIRPCGISNAWQFFVLGFLVGAFRACGMGQAHAKAVGLLPRTQKGNE